MVQTIKITKKCYLIWASTMYSLKNYTKRNWNVFEFCEK